MTPDIDRLVEQAIVDPWCYYNGDLYRGDPETVPAALAAYDAADDADWPFEDRTAEETSVFAGDPWHSVDAEWIAAARSTLPSLVTELTEARRRVEAVRGALLPPGSSLLTYEALDVLVDTDPIELREYALRVSRIVADAATALSQP